MISTMLQDMAKRLFSVAVLCLTAASAVAADEAAEQREAKQKYGILPSLSALLPPDSPLRLKFPVAEEPPEKGQKYEKTFPFGAQAAIDRGVTLPEPWGISVSFIENNQAQGLADLSVALGKGAPPPAGTDLTDLPFVSLTNVESRTRTKQVRADLWVLPFLNVFGGIGIVDGEVPLTVVVDLNETDLCPPIVTCRSVGASFEAGVDTNTATIGMTGAYGWENWYVTGTASATASFGGNTEDAVRSYSVSGRVGRRWAFGPGHIISPFVGVSYLNLDQIVEGTTRLNDAFPDGDSLDVRYRVKVSNSNKWSGVLGLNLGFVQGYSVAAEVNMNSTDERLLVSASKRF